MPQPSSSSNSCCPVPPAVLSACTRPSSPTSSNFFAGLMPAGRDVERPSTPYTVRRWALSTLDCCSTKTGDCVLRYAHESLRANYVFKLSIFYESDMGIVWYRSDNLRTGNHARSALVTSYTVFSREEKKKKAGVTVKQAPALLSSHLRVLVVPMGARLCCTEDTYTRALLTRDITLFTVTFRTTRRGDELSRTLIQRILCLPNECGLLFNF